MGEWISVIIGSLFAGIIIGPLARLVMPGKQDIGILATIVAGAVGAFIGGALANILGVGETDGIDWIKHGLQVVAGAVAVGGYLAIKKD